MVYRFFLKGVFLCLVFCQASSLLYAMDDCPMEEPEATSEGMTDKDTKDADVDMLACRISGLVIVTEGLKASSGCPFAPRAGDRPDGSFRGDSIWTVKRRRVEADDRGSPIVVLWPNLEGFVCADVCPFSMGTFIRRKAKKGSAAKKLAAKRLKRRLSKYKRK